MPILNSSFFMKFKGYWLQHWFVMLTQTTTVKNVNIYWYQCTYMRFCHIRNLWSTYSCWIKHIILLNTGTCVRRVGICDKEEILPEHRLHLCSRFSLLHTTSSMGDTWKLKLNKSKKLLRFYIIFKILYSNVIYLYMLLWKQTIFILICT